MTALHADAVEVLSRVPCPPEFEALLAAGPHVLYRDGGPDHVTASTLILDATLDRVLLCLHGRFHRWVQMGGHCEPDDTTLAGVARREAEEESGIVGLRLAADPIGVDIHPVRCASGESRHFDVRYAAIAPPDAVPILSPESADLRWFPVDALPTPLAHATDILVAPARAAFA